MADETDLIDGAEILMDPPIALRGENMLRALAATKPPNSVVTTKYAGAHRLLVLYGVGLPVRMAARERHLSRGGHVVTWDLGYWDREEAMRVAVDRLHPGADQLAAAPEGGRRAFELRQDASHDGPVMLVGLGRKSAVMLGMEALSWERRRLRDIKARFPGRPVLWRPKGVPIEMPGTRLSHGTPIEMALNGCSLVVCRHSNVAVDACVAGVPVECEDGAAHALYANGSDPTPAERADFLRRLTWWNYRPSEAAQAWQWMWRMAE